MIAIRSCETDQDFTVAAVLMSELSVWDSAETAKLGFSAQSILDFYYAPGSGLADAFAPPLGTTLLGYSDDEVGGCIAYRQLKPNICELKRLYVRPCLRRTGLGRALVSDLIMRARASNFTRMRLETVSFMGTAIQMYEAMGFVRCAPYYAIPEIFLPITIFMEKNLVEPESLPPASRGE